MRYSTVGLLASLASTALAQTPDLLFIDSLLYGEYVEATEDLGFTASVVDEATWRNMTTEDFAAYKAIILSDPDCGDISNIQFLEDTRTVWSPAVTGNMIIIGTDPTRHLGTGGAEQLMRNSIQFSAAGTDGNLATGLYFSLSCYYNDVETAQVTSLDQFGDFEVRGNLSCYNDIHLVAQSAAIDSLGDADLSNWDCSVHEAFSSYPSNGVNGFNALAIANNVLGDGSQQFADGSTGLPYIISRGASPVACGDGNWDGSYGEECDDGNLDNGDGCSSTCRCESNVPLGNGTCGPAVCGDGILSPGEQCDDNNTNDGDGCSSTCQCESGVPNGDGTCGVAPDNSGTTTILTSTSIVIATSTSVTLVTSTTDGGSGTSTSTSTSATSDSSILGQPTSTSTSGFNNGTTSATSGTTSEATSTTSGSSLSTVAPGQQSTSVVLTTSTSTQTVYIRPSCPTTSLIIGAEIIVHVTTDGAGTGVCSTLQRPIYDYPRSGLPCYVCEMKSEGLYPSGGYGFMTVSTTACPSCAGGALPTPALPVLYTSSGCAAQTMANSAPWYGAMPTGGAAAGGAVPYAAPSPHNHQAPGSQTGAYVYPTAAVTKAGQAASMGAASMGAATKGAATNNGNNANAAATPAATGAGGAAAAPYPAGNNGKTAVAGVAAAGTGTGSAIYPTNSVLAFQGGASSSVGIALGAIGGAILGLVALL